MIFKFDKPFLDKQQLLEMFNLSNGTLERYKEQWLKDGKDLSEMGHLRTLQNTTLRSWNKRNSKPVFMHLIKT